MPNPKSPIFPQGSESTDPRTSQLFRIGGNGFVVESTRANNPNTSNVSAGPNNPEVLNVPVVEKPTQNE
jgi:hypothetical protein